MILSKSNFSSPARPERILQFGTSVLLRGLCDYFVDKANKQGLYDGQIVVVKSTDTGNTDGFDAQNGLYTIAVRGLENGETLKENIVSSAISRVLSAKNQWNEIVEVAKSEALEVVISNTTEIGLQYVEENIFQSPPASFPAKLLAVLYNRFEHLPQKGLVIIPTELIVDNGRILKEIVLKLAHYNKLSPEFIKWIDTKNHFCNSLVDRIVPGKPSTEKLNQLTQELGYEDSLLIETEAYRLWAIEGSKEVKNILSFADADEGMIVEPDIRTYRELKLRLLNGTHTLMCGLGYLHGFNLVREVMADGLMSQFVQLLMLSEIAPAIPYRIDSKKVQRFGYQTLDRFRNPFLDHKLLDITVQYTAKMKMRNVPLLLNFQEEFNTIPHYFCYGFAGYLLFMKAVKYEDGIYYGQRNGEFYPIKCESAGVFYELWKKATVSEVVDAALSNTSLWGTDLSALPKFATHIKSYLSVMLMAGVREALLNREVVI
jgi:tagaturonate reductase